MEGTDYRLSLWQEFMEKTSYIPEKKREIMGQIAGCYVEDRTFLSEVYAAFIEKERFLEDKENEVRYERDGEDYILSWKGKECFFDKIAFQKVLASMLDLLEDMLPLGSVVDLKKEFYKGKEEIEEIEHLRMVVSYRFLGKEEDAYYFPYAGVVYPTGMMGQEEVLYFTRPLVETIVKEGYRDEQEEAYVYLMKQELVIEKGKNTFGYASRAEIETFNKRKGAGETWANN